VLKWPRYPSPCRGGGTRVTWGFQFLPFAKKIFFFFTERWKRQSIHLPTNLPFKLVKRENEKGKKKRLNLFIYLFIYLCSYKICLRIFLKYCFFNKCQQMTVRKYIPYRLHRLSTNRLSRFPLPRRASSRAHALRTVRSFWVARCCEAPLRFAVGWRARGESREASSYFPTARARISVLL
jgi:hypothetical protein